MKSTGSEILEAVHRYTEEHGKPPEIITISNTIYTELTGETRHELPPGMIGSLFGVKCEVSEELTGKTFVFGNVQNVKERPDKEMVYHWVGCCLPGNCHDVNGKMCPYHCRTNCRRALAADFAFYAWGELLNGKKGGNR